MYLQPARTKRHLQYCSTTAALSFTVAATAAAAASMHKQLHPHCNLPGAHTQVNSGVSSILQRVFSSACGSCICCMRVAGGPPCAMYVSAISSFKLRPGDPRPSQNAKPHTQHLPESPHHQHARMHSRSHSPHLLVHYYRPNNRTCQVVLVGPNQLTPSQQQLLLHTTHTAADCS
jgi:hypothetical protein